MRSMLKEQDNGKENDVKKMANKCINTDHKKLHCAMLFASDYASC
jgi:hypothetical protein